MTHTEFVVRCSGRIEYASTLIGAGILSYILIRMNKWVVFPLDLFLGLIGAIALVSIILAFIRAKIQYIEVDEEGITMHMGLFNKKTVYVPYERITNIAVHRNLVERIFLLGSLQIDTAGTNRAEINMKNIPAKYLDRIIKSVHRNIGNDDEGI